jgi:hypothetical protein
MVSSVEVVWCSVVLCYGCLVLACLRLACLFLSFLFVFRLLVLVCLVLCRLVSSWLDLSCLVFFLGWTCLVWSFFLSVSLSLFLSCVLVLCCPVLVLCCCVLCCLVLVLCCRVLACAVLFCLVYRGPSLVIICPFLYLTVSCIDLVLTFDPGH